MPSQKKKLSVAVSNGLLSLDSPGEFAFISHAHSDHISALKSKKLIASEETLDLLQARGYCNGEIAKRKIDLEGIKLLDAGHVLGSKQILVENSYRFIYTGDFKVEESLTQKKAEISKAEILAIDCTFGRREYVFPEREKIYEEIGKWVKENLERNFSILIGGYSLGKAQELVKLLNSYLDLEPIVTTEIAKINEIYKKYGISLKYIKETSEEAREILKRQFVAIVPFHKANSRFSKTLSEYYKMPIKTAVATGWALHKKFSADEAFCLSDHADFKDMLEYVEYVNPKRVICTNGFNKEFARELRRREYTAVTLESVKVHSLLEY